MPQHFNAQKLKNWFQEKGRDLPWRNAPSAYAVWISEMMLQQTQVAVVIPYFERWMKRFPTVQDLAQASLEEVIKMWEGLGYYSRARYLHEGARYVLEKHHGQLPESLEELAKIKGLGVYTVGAIRSFAFHQQTTAVDGNVLRVLARYFYIKEDISKPKTIKAIRELAFQILPTEESWVFNEALIELGATLCARKPQCHLCPIQTNCQSYLQGATALIPYKSPKSATVSLYRAVAILSWNHKFLVKKGEKGKIMSDLYEFPYFEIGSSGIDQQQFSQKIQEQFQIKPIWQQTLSQVKHSFTNYRAHLTPMCFLFPDPIPHTLLNDFEWFSHEQLLQLPFSSGHRRILQILNK